MLDKKDIKEIFSISKDGEFELSKVMDHPEISCLSLESKERLLNQLLKIEKKQQNSFPKMNDDVILLSEFFKDAKNIF